MIDVFADKDLQKFVLLLNKSGQLFQNGIDATGTVIGEYSPVTEQLNEGKVFSFDGKRRTKKAGEPIFLYDTGDFYRSFKVVVKKDGFVIEANTNVEDGRPLDKQFGKDILGLTNESKGIISKAIQKEVAKGILQAIRKGL